MSNGIINMYKNIATVSFHPNYLASGKCCIAVGYKREERVWLISDDGMELLSPWKHKDPPSRHSLHRAILELPGVLGAVSPGGLHAFVRLCAR